MVQSGTQTRPGLLTTLRAFFFGVQVNRQTQTSKYMPDLEDWSMPHRGVDLTHWEVAYNAAKNPLMPDRTRLLDVYDSILIDSHLASGIESRVLRVCRSKFKIIDKDGKPRPDLLHLFEHRWFEDLLTYITEAEFRGHTVIELSELDAPGQLRTVTRINPRNVLPRHGLIVRRPGDTQGYKFREGPLKPYLIEVGRPDDLGSLAAVGPVAILKKYALGSWGDYMHKFGVPPRWVRSNTTDLKRLKQLETIMRSMVSSGIGVFANDETVEIMQSPGVDAHKVFDEMIKRLNSEMSKRILGQDGTSDNTDAKGTYGSLQVLQGVAEDRHMSDKASVAYVINNELLPRLIDLSYPLQGMRFAWDELKDLSAKDLVEAVTKLGAVFDIDPKHVEERTGIRILGARRMPGEVTDPKSGVGRQGGKKKAEQDPEGEEDDDEDGVIAHWPARNLPICSTCGGSTDPVAAGASIREQAVERMLQDIYAGREWSQEYFEETSGVLAEGLISSWGTDLRDLRYDEPDHVARAIMEANVFRFAAAKTLAVALDLNEHVRASKGYADFKRRVDESGRLDEYNRNYLETEYVTAVNTGIQASRWYQLQRASDVLRFGEYTTQQDTDVRPAHEKLHGRKWPLDHEIWEKIAPPNGYRCRCTILGSTDGVEGAALEEQTQEALKQLEDSGELDRMRKGGFDVNRAVTGEVFKIGKSYREQLGDKAGRPFALTVQDSYGPEADQYTMEAINARPRPQAAPAAPNKDAARALIDFKDDVATFRDQGNRLWRMRRGMVNHHLDDPKYASQERYKTLHLVPEVLSQPDEIWLNTKGAATQRLSYVRFYDGLAVVVRGDMDMTNDRGLDITTWYPLDTDKADSIRSGILVKKMAE